MRREADATGEDAARIMCMCFLLHLLCSKIDELVYCDHSAVSVSSCDQLSGCAPIFRGQRNAGRSQMQRCPKAVYLIKPTSGTGLSLSTVERERERERERELFIEEGSKCLALIRQQRK